VKDSEMKELIREIEQNAPNHIYLVNQNAVVKELLQQQDLMIIGHESWKNLVEKQTAWLANTPSVLIISEDHIHSKALN